MPSAPPPIEIGIDADDVRRVRRSLKGMEGAVDDLKAVHARAAAVVEKEAARIVPRRSGRLAQSLRSSGQARTGIIRAGKVAVPYAGVTHYGWAKHNIEAQPFLTDAYRNVRRQVADIYDDGMTGLIRKHDLN
jgi:phage gpG-like protein